MGFQPVERLPVFRLGQRHRKERTGAGPDHVGVVDVGALVAEDETIHSGGVGAAEHGAEVSRFFDRLRHQIESVRADRKFGEEVALHPCDCDQSLRPFAVGHLLQQLGGEFDHPDPLGGEGFEERILIFPEKMGGGEEAFHQLHAVLPCPGQFAVAFEDGQLFLFAGTPVSQFDHVLDRVVPGAGDFLEFHGCSGVAVIRISGLT